jgi:predicted nuclease of predicted toxin-antitoxin system
MKIILDMNISPDWATVLNDNGHEAVHWSSVGQANDSDQLIAGWAASNRAVVVTNDMDFGELLVLTNATKPSVIAFRKGRNAAHLHQYLLLRALTVCRSELEAGALIIINQGRQRMRLLPLGVE